MKADRIKKGFETPWWVALEDTDTVTCDGSTFIRIHVQLHANGRDDYRLYFPDEEVPERDSSDQVDKN